MYYKVYQGHISNNIIKFLLWTEIIFQVTSIINQQVNETGGKATKLVNCG